MQEKRKSKGWLQLPRSFTSPDILKTGLRRGGGTFLWLEHFSGYVGQLASLLNRKVSNDLEEFPITTVQ